MDKELQITPVRLADGQEYELSYGIGSTLWLLRKHGINLVNELSGGVTDVTDQSQVAALSAKRMSFLMGNIDTLIMAGIMDDRGKEPRIDASLILALPGENLSKLSIAAFGAILRDVIIVKKATEVKDPNASENKVQ